MIHWWRWRRRRPHWVDYKPSMGMLTAWNTYHQDYARWLEEKP